MYGCMNINKVSPIKQPAWTKVYNSVIDNSHAIGSTAFHVYVSLVRHADQGGTCWPSQSRLAKMTGLQVRTVRKQIKVLEAAGLIQVESRTDGKERLSNLYRIVEPPDSPRNETTLPPERNDPRVRNETTLPPRNETTYEQEPIEQDIVNKKKARPAAASVSLPPELNTDEFKSAWATFQQHRREKKSAMTPTAISRAIAKLERMGHDRAVAALEHSTANGWTGIFEPSCGNGQKTEQIPYKNPYRD